MRKVLSERLERKIILDWLRSQDAIYERRKYHKLNKDESRQLIYSFFVKDNLEELDGKFLERFSQPQELYLTRQVYGEGFLYLGRNIEVEITQKSRALPNNPDTLWGWFIYKNRMRTKPLSYRRLQQEFPRYQNEFEALRKKVRKANGLAIFRKLE